MYYDFFNRIMGVCSKGVVRSALNQAVKTHPIHKVLRQIRNLRSVSGKGDILLLQLALYSARLSIVSLYVNCWPFTPIRTTISLLKKSDAFLVEFFSRCELTLCRPINLNASIVAKNIVSASELCIMEQQMAKMMEFELIQHSMNEIQMIRTMFLKETLRKKEQIHTSARNYFEDFFYHPKWYEIILILICIYMKLIMKLPVTQIAIYVAGADLTVRFIGIPVRFLRVLIGKAVLSSANKILMLYQLLHTNGWNRKIFRKLSMRVNLISRFADFTVCNKNKYPISRIYMMMILFFITDLMHQYVSAMH